MPLVRSSTLIRALAIYSLALVSVAGVLNGIGNEDPDARAVALMGVTLVYVWVGGFGWLSYRGANAFRAMVQRLPGPWSVWFVVFATAFALMEEAVTVSLTNLAGIFGSQPGKAWITASTNYLDVVLLSSIAPLVLPWILVWAALLRRYAFPPNHVFLMFGLLGTLAESLSSPEALIGGVWFFVYGLMVYLPAYGFAPCTGATVPRLRHYGLALVLPVLAAAPMMALATTIREHLGIHFFTDGLS